MVVTALVHYTTIYLPSLWPSHSCNLDCLELYFGGITVLHDHPELIPTIRNHYLHPPIPTDDPVEEFDVTKPVWKELVQWDQFQDILRDLWKDKPPGVFVEVGAADGEFMSQTLMLERNLGWSGLLVEPDPRAFTILQQRRRHRSWTSPVCIQRYAPITELYWLHDLIPDISDDFQGLVMARSKLAEETVTGDMEEGSLVRVPCMPLSRLLVAANMTQVDFLTISTGTPADEKKILDVVRNSTFNVKTILIHYHESYMLTQYFIPLQTIPIHYHESYMLTQYVISLQTILIHYPRSYILSHPYPFLSRYVLDMDRSRLLTKLYWRRADCVVVQEGVVCRRAKPYDLVESCWEYKCLGDFSVWTFSLDFGSIWSNTTESVQTSNPSSTTVSG
ncbi:hypothetical protein Pcinc_015807 [Petrolisthes cinctipes]|uniref:Uncharacterized protein n=1 Tax=Petrolisthes cinctipes TaxID=88211 RepID=A0AAE1KMP9_PETCI|nr:hypothetical protein Pcinc_015807 [Petrolisthes cinctipes]